MDADSCVGLYLRLLAGTPVCSISGHLGALTTWWLHFKGELREGKRHGHVACDLDSEVLQHQFHPSLFIVLPATQWRNGEGLEDLVGSEILLWPFWKVKRSFLSYIVMNRNFFPGEEGNIYTEYMKKKSCVDGNAEPFI